MLIGRISEFNEGQLDRVWKNKRMQCEKFECADYIVDEAMNCVNNCTSPVCYMVHISTFTDTVLALITPFIGSIWRFSS
jgi:hypothetical protein